MLSTKSETVYSGPTIFMPAVHLDPNWVPRALAGEGVPTWVHSSLLLESEQMNRPARAARSALLIVGSLSVAGSILLALAFTVL